MPLDPQTQTLGVPNVPPDSANASAPAIAPWALDGVTLEPPLSREATGWQPYPALPPDYRIANWFQALAGQFFARVGNTGAFVQCSTLQIDLGGGNTAGNVLQFAYNANTVNYVMGPETLSETATAWAAQINAATTVNNFVRAYPTGTPQLFVLFRQPGVDFDAPSTATAVSGDTTVACTQILGAGSGSTGDGDNALSVWTSTAGLGIDFLHGGPQEGAGTKLQFRSAKAGAFRAGQFSGTQADLANVGAASFAAGVDVMASGSGSVATGSGSTAAGNYAQAHGLDCSATQLLARAHGQAAVTDSAHEVALASGGAAGKSQSGQMHLYRDTSNTDECLPNAITVANSSEYLFKFKAVAKWLTGGSGAAGDMAAWDFLATVTVDNAGAVTINTVIVLGDSGGRYSGAVQPAGSIEPTVSVGSGSDYLLAIGTDTNAISLFAQATSGTPGDHGTVRFGITAEWVKVAS